MSMEAQAWFFSWIEEVIESRVWQGLRLVQGVGFRVFDRVHLA